MSIYKPALDRINKAQLTGPTCATLFEVLSQKMAESGAVSAEFKLGYVDAKASPDQLPQPGEYVPEIILRLTAPV
jgi:hypothetical protein